VYLKQQTGQCHLANRRGFCYNADRYFFVVLTGTDIAVWTVSALLAIGVGWSRYANWKTRHNLVRELAAMDPDRREKVLSRLSPKLALEIRQQLMERFRIMS
jgi:hypothetical protein